MRETMFRFISVSFCCLVLLGFFSGSLLAQFAVAADGDAEARKKLVGTWEGRVDRGATGHKLTISAAGIMAKKGETQDLGEGTFKLDLTKRPWRMDATRSNAPQEGETYLGIYSLEGDTLKWCVSTPGQERPTEFATQGWQYLLILKRQKD